MLSLLNALPEGAVTLAYRARSKAVRPARPVGFLVFSSTHSDC